MVNNSDITEYRHIETGDVVDDSMRLVTDGLGKDERYVTKGLMKVRNGMKVTPIMEK